MSYENYMKQYNKIGYSVAGITHIKDFINQTDIKILEDYMQFAFGFGNLYRDSILDPKVTELLSVYQSAAHKELIKHYGIPYDIKFLEEPRQPAHLTKWDMLLGSSMSVHSDAETPSGKPAILGGFYRYNITAIAYVTDQYVGGEITFPDFDGLKIKPKAGDLLLFPSRYRHCISNLDSGARYTMPMFFGFDVEDNIPFEDITGSLTNDVDPSDILFFE
jgi:hypothetical protein